MTSILFDETRREWALQDGDLLYILGLDEDGALQHRYSGVPFGDGSRSSEEILSRWDFPFDSWWESPPRWEYPVRGPYVFGETTLAVLFGPADRDLHLRYAEHEIDDDRLRIRLVDAYHPLTVELHYELAPVSGVVRRWAVIRNDDASPVLLEQAAPTLDSK